MICSIYCRLIILISTIFSKFFLSLWGVNFLTFELNIIAFRALSTKISLDGQGRLVHRDTGKIILPFEHFANAIILKHMSGINSNHLSLDATIKSVFESYSCGKENFGFDKDFIIEVVNSCPSTSCRYFKGPSVSYEQHPNFPPPPQQINMDYIPPTRQSPMLMQPPVMSDPSKIGRGLTNQQLTQQMIQQQNRAMSQSMENLEKQRVMQQLDKKHFETVAAIVQANNNLGLPTQPPPMVPTAAMMQPQVHHNKTMNYSRRSSYDGIETYSAASYATSNKELLHNNWTTTAAVAAPIQQIPPMALERDGMIVGQEKIVRAFAELMKNMARMKAFIRPSMVKPYGKQSESLQKTLMDSIQLVQTLRNFLPKPHISISNWKSVDQVDSPIQ